MKSCIHSSDWDKLIAALEKALPEDWFKLVMKILEKFCSHPL